MEFISSTEYFVFQNLQKGESNLWIHRNSGQFSVRPSWDLASLENPVCLGLVYGIIGKFTLHPDLPPRLLIIKSVEKLGEIPDTRPDETSGGDPKFRQSGLHPVYKVISVLAVPITSGPFIHDSNHLKGVSKASKLTANW